MCEGQCLLSFLASTAKMSGQQTNKQSTQIQKNPITQNQILRISYPPLPLINTLPSKRRSQKTPPPPSTHSNPSQLPPTHLYQAQVQSSELKNTRAPCPNNGRKRHLRRDKPSVGSSNEPIPTDWTPTRGYLGLKRRERGGCKVRGIS